MRTWVTMLIGLGVLGMSLAAWLYGEKNGIDTRVLWTVVPSLLIALFIGNSIGTNTEVTQKAADAAQMAATQTNGTLAPRIEAAVSSALAKRDAARTRQAQGDISQDVTMPPAPAVVVPEVAPVLTETWPAPTS